jgi:hypothetical protein
MMRSRAPVHWGRCWTEAPVAGIAMGNALKTIAVKQDIV